MRVSAVDDDVSFLEKGYKFVDETIDCSACLNEENDLAWSLEQGNKLCEILFSLDSSS